MASAPPATPNPAFPRTPPPEPVESVAGIDLESALQAPAVPAHKPMPSLAEPSGSFAQPSPAPLPDEHDFGAEALDARFTHLLDTVHRNRPNDDLDLIRRAWAFCIQQHDGQKRASGEPYIIHPLEVCQILADLRMDATAIAAGLLHDAVEDTDVTSPEIARRFNEPGRSHRRRRHQARQDQVRPLAKTTRPRTSARCSSPW